MDIKSSIIACGLICSLQLSRAAQCTYTLTPASISPSASATSGSFTVSVGSTCSWTATTTNTSWVHPTGSGTGNGTVNYIVDANPNPSARVGGIVVGSKTFVVNQAAAPMSLSSALDTSNLVWTTASDFPWSGTTSLSHDGVASATCGNHFVPDSTSWIQTTVTGPGTLTFWWRVDSDVTPPPPADPVSFDYLEFDINGIEQEQIMGQVEWNFRSYQIPEGTTTLNWQYVKDSQFNSGNDRAWLDQVAFVPGAPVSLPEALNACGASWTSGGSVPTSWIGQNMFTHDGQSAAQSGAVDLSQDTWMQAVVIGVTNFSYWWKVSCQTNFDYLEFYTNGVLAKRITGEVNWTSNFFKLPATTNTLKWRYVTTNMMFTSQGMNHAWVDEVLLSPNDLLPPTILYSPPDISLSVGANCQAALPDFTGTNYFLALDTCTSVTVTQSPLAGTLLSAGSYPIVLTARDAAGNAVRSTNTVIVVDTNAPVITVLGSNPMTVECHSTFLDPGATALDNCDGTVSVTTNGTVLPNSLGTYVITYIASDLVGNSATNTRTINVVDTTAPVVQYQFTNLTVSANSNCQAVLPDLTGTNYFIALDNCSSVVVTQMPPAGTLLAPGTNLLVLTARDAIGNFTQSSNTVTVIDSTPPLLTLLGSNVMTIECHSTFADPGATAIDACSGAVIVTTNSTVLTDTPGSYTITYSATDTSGNSVTNTRTVNVVDTTPPVLTLLGSNVMTIECHSTFTDPGATAIDACSGQVVVIANGTVLANSPGVYTLTYTASDNSGNSATNSRTVNVVDTTPPTISYYFTNLILNAGANCQATLPDLTGTNYILALDLSGSVTVTQSLPVGAILSKGTNQVTLTAFDASGNLSSVTGAVFVVDVTPPVLVAPATVMVSTAPGQCTATNVPLGAPTVSDNCQLASVTNNAPQSYGVGTNLVTWTASDADGNITNATQIVIVNDTQPPSLSCPPTVTVPANAGQNYASNVVLGNPVASDNCGVVAVINDAPAQFPLGTNLVTWTAFDFHGNSNSCLQQVIVASAAQTAQQITGIVNNGNGTFTLTFLGSAGLDYVVQVSTNLLDWSSVQTNRAGEDGTWSFVDHNTAGYTRRFYRSARP